MNPKEFMEKWVAGIHNITPLQQLHAKMIGHIGGFFGLIFAMVVLAFQGMWAFTIFLIFMIFLQYLEFIGVRQQWKQACEIQQRIFEAGVKNETEETD